MTWGRYLFGGDSSDVQDQLRNVQQIRATSFDFAAILADGSVVTWGSPDFPEEADSFFKVQDKLRRVQHVQSTGWAFAAILEDGMVVTWLDPRHGGDSSEVSDQLRNVQQVQGTDAAFAAILADGSVTFIMYSQIYSYMIISRKIPPGNSRRESERIGENRRESERIGENGITNGIEQV